MLPPKYVLKSIFNDMTDFAYSNVSEANINQHLHSNDSLQNVPNQQHLTLALESSLAGK